jgi:hypothetical protein
MDIFVRFIGLMLLVQAHPGGPYQAIIPKWEQTDRFCNVNIMRHAAYIRVQSDNKQVVDDSKWPKDPAVCDKCILYPIAVESTLTIDGGFTPAAGVTPAQLPCFVPNLRKEKLVHDATLHKDALTTRSIADYQIASGQLSAFQFKNDMIFLVQKIPAPQGSTAHNITVTAQPRVGGTPRVLVVAPGTTIDIIDLPPQFAGGDYELESTDSTMNGHFFFLHKLLAKENPNTDCNLVPRNAPSGCIPRLRDHKPGGGVTLNLNCGPGGG